MSTPETPQNPAQPVAPTYQAAPAPAAEPGKGLSIAAIILAIFVPLVGIILGIVALVQSKKAGRKNGLALAAIIVGAALIVIGIIIWIVVLGSLAAAGGGILDAAEACMNGATTVEVAGQIVECSDVVAE